MSPCDSDKGDTAGSLISGQEQRMVRRHRYIDRTDEMREFGIEAVRQIDIVSHKEERDRE